MTQEWGDWATTQQANAYAQQYVPLSQAGYADYCVNSHKGQRDMWREDLGLSTRVEAWASTLTMVFISRQRMLWREHQKPSASYAFWLGAEAA